MPGSLSALIRFHVAGGARVASRNAVVTICLILFVLGSAPDPLILLRRLALGLAADGVAGGPLVAVAILAYAIAREAVPRLTLGLGGWTRSLPADGVQHRRAVMFGLPIVQLPFAAAVALAAGLTLAVYDRPLSGPKLLGASLALCAAGAAAVPARRWVIAAPAFALSAVLAALGRWTTLAAAIALFIIADATAGGLAFPARRAAVPSPALPGSLRLYRFTWRAVGWRMLAPVPLSCLALAAAWFYTRNNELAPPDVGFVARLWSVIAIALYLGAMGDIVVTRRPVWPWLRSLPLSSVGRATDDTIALGLPALGIALASAVVDPGAAVIALATLPPLAALAAAATPGARKRLTRVSGMLVVAGAVLGTACAYVPWVGPVALLATPLVVRLAAARGRREVVTGWNELYHDAAGDTLVWSTR